MTVSCTRLGSGTASKDPRNLTHGGAVVEDGQSVSQGKLDQLSRYGEREVGVFS